MGEVGICGMGTGVDSFFPEELGTNNSISRLVLSNNSLYNLCSFTWKLVYLGKSPSSKIACVEEKKIVFPYIWCIKWYLLFSYPINIINSEYGVSLLAQVSIGRNT